MANRSWHDQTEAELARRGVPARFRRRLLAELRDHADDLTEEERDMSDEAMERRLGPPAEVAATAAEQYRRATWVGRHPLIVFGLLPIPGMVVSLIGGMILLELLIFVIVQRVYGTWGAIPRTVLVSIVYALAYGIRFLPFVALMTFFTRLYVRHTVSWRWYAVAAAQVLFFAGTLVSTLIVRDEPGQSMWILGFAWGAPFAPDWAKGLVLPPLVYLGWAQAAQLAVPATVAWLMLRAARRREAAVAMA